MNFTFPQCRNTEKKRGTPCTKHILLSYLHFSDIQCKFSTFDLMFIILRSVKVHGGCVPVQRIDGVGVGEQLREERLEDVGEVWRMWRERLVSTENRWNLSTSWTISRRVIPSCVRIIHQRSPMSCYVELKLLHHYIVVLFLFFCLFLHILCALDAWKQSRFATG